MRETTSERGGGEWERDYVREGARVSGGWGKQCERERVRVSERVK